VLGAIPTSVGRPREPQQAFDIVTNLPEERIEDVSGIGMSSIARETNFYHTKMFLHHYAGQGSGFLWNMFGQKAHALDGFELAPHQYRLAPFSDLDAPMLWFGHPEAGCRIRLPASRSDAQQTA